MLELMSMLFGIHFSFICDKKQESHLYQKAELGTRSFLRGSLSAPHSFFSPGSLTLMRSFFELPFSLVAQPVVRWAKKG
jgi:hypothetical protein